MSFNAFPIPTSTFPSYAATLVGRLLFGSSAQIAVGNASSPTWVQSQLFGGVDAATTLMSISPTGQFAALMATRSSENATNNQTICEYVEVENNNTGATAITTWGHYVQGNITNTANILQHFNEESSVANAGATIKIDPFQTNITGATENLRLDSGTGSASNPVSAALHILKNGGVYESAIVISSDALDSTFNEAIALAVGHKINYYSSSATVACSIAAGTGSPNNVVTAGVGSIFLRTDGGASTTLYVKESGTGNTGWVAK